MSEHAVAQTQKANTPQETTKSVISLQRRPTNLPEPTIMQEWLLDTASGTFTEPRFGYDFSRVPAHSNVVQQTFPLLRTRTMVQRFSKNGAAGSAPCPAYTDEESTLISAPAEPAAETTESSPMVAPSAAPAEPMTEPVSPETETTPALAEPTTEPAAPGETTASGLIVEDSVTELAPGQMRKSEFLAQLRTEVCRTVETAIAETGQTTDGCPYIGRWFDFYSRKDSAHIERAIRRYAPESSNATTARGYISAVTQRAHQSAETWARTGEITGVPEGMPMGLPGMGLLGGVGRLISGIGGIFFKAREGGARAADNPQAIQAELGEGHPLDSSVRSRMESAFGMGFSHVRTHTDANAAGLSNRLNARAFTVGEHVAFGSGEYRPGTLIGDALIAHEMAHVVQQSGGGASVAPMQTGEASYNILENDADKSAIGAIASLWTGAKDTLSDIAKNAIPRLKSGLRLSRCKQEPTLKSLTVSNSTSANTFNVPSNIGASGKQHWVTVEKAGGVDPIVEANIGISASDSRASKLSWTINGTAASATGDPLHVSVPRSMGKKVVRATWSSNSRELTIWIIDAAIGCTGPTDSITPTATDLMVSTNADFEATVRPASVIADTDHPDLAGTNTVNPPGGTNSCGAALSGGADHKWDVSRQIRMKNIDPAGHLPQGCVDTVGATYPANDIEGNDDAGTADENNDPYAGGGKITSSDTPSRFYPNAIGSNGDAIEQRLHFREFARVELNKEWWKISDFFPWRFHIRVEKVGGSWTDDMTDSAADNTGF